MFLGPTMRVAQADWIGTARAGDYPQAADLMAGVFRAVRPVPAPLWREIDVQLTGRV